MANPLSQAQIPVFATTTDLTAYAPDGLFPGFVAFTTTPASRWSYTTAAAPAGTSSVAAAAGGNWIQSGADASQVRTVVFAPGGVAAPGVYTTEAATIAAIKNTTGPVTVFFDASLAPTPGTIALTGDWSAVVSPCVEFTSAMSGGPSVAIVTCATNVKLPPGLSVLSGAVALKNIGTTVPLQLTAGAVYTNFTMRDLSSMGASGGQPVITFATDDSGTQELNLYLLGYANINAPTGGGTSVVKITGTGYLLLTAEMAAIVAGNTIGLPTSAQFAANGNAGATVVTAQVGVLDTGLISVNAFVLGQGQRNSCGPAGANLTDADASINTAGRTWRILPAATLTANRILTLAVLGAQPSDQITITRRGTEAFTYTIKDGSGTTLLVMPASKANSGLFQYNGTAWEMRQCGVQ